MRGNEELRGDASRGLGALDVILDELRPALRAKIADIAESLLGPPDKRQREEWRWGSKHGMCVFVAGPKQGGWVDYTTTPESDPPGDPLGLIMREKHCDFIGAVKFGCQFVGIAFDQDGRQEDPDVRAAREAKQQADRNRKQAKAEADGSRRSASAHRLWDASGPIDGTVAEHYLTSTRAIPRPSGGWPEAVRFHEGSRALILAGTDASGSVRFVQRVYLTPDGQKISDDELQMRGLPAAKLSNGVMQGAIVRFPGPVDGPLLLAEGPETGLSLWAATRYETHLSIGSITRHEPAGRRAVVCRDDDPQQSSADMALKRSMSNWQSAGADVVTATPWPIRRFDKSDFNDVLQEGGVEAVRARVAAALKPPHEPVSRLTVEDGRVALRTAADAFFEAAKSYNGRVTLTVKQAKAALTADAPFVYEVMESRRAWAEFRAAAKEARRLAKVRPVTNDSRAAATAAKAAARAARERASEASEIAAAFTSETQKLQRAIAREAKAKGRAAAGTPPVHAIKVDVGAGKSQASMANIVVAIRTMRAAGDKRPVVVAIPTHKLGDQQLQRLTGMLGADGIKAAVWRSRKAKSADGQPMCLDLDAVADAEEAMADIQTSVCRQKTSDSVRLCPFFAQCPFQKQRAAKPDVWFIPHELLFGPKPATIGIPAILVVDESAWQDGLFGIEHPISLLLDTLVDEDTVVPGDPLATGQLKSSRTSLFDALSGMMDSATEHDTFLPVRRSDVIERGIDATAARGAYATEWMRKIEPNIYPGMPRESRKEAVRAAMHNKVVSKLAMVWEAVRHLVADDGPEQSGWISLGISKTTEGTAPAIHIKGRRNIHESWDVPTLLLDATMQRDLVRPFWPTMHLTADIRLQMPYQHVIQVTDRSYSKTQLARASGLRDVHVIICREARRYAPARVLAVVQKAIEEALPNLGPLPDNLELAHHNAVSGRDEWGPGPERQGVAALIVVGRTAPSPGAVETMAEALTGAAIERTPAGQWYPKAEAVREMSDGTFRPTETDRHPHPIAEAIRWHITEGELVQILGRPRGVNRTEANPVDILLMTNAALPVPLTRVISAAELEPSPTDLMLGAGGVAFNNPTDAARSYPVLWPTPNAAGLAWRRGGGQNQRGCGDFVIGDSLLRNHRDLGGNVPHLLKVSYQLAGIGRAPSVALYDPAIVPDLPAWLNGRLGVLAWFGSPRARATVMNVVEAMVAHGLISLNSRHNATIYPDLFASSEAAKKAVDRARAGRCVFDLECAQRLTWQVRYQVAGHGTRPTDALVDLYLIPDPAVWLAERLGALAAFEAVQVASAVDQLMLAEGLPPSSMFPPMCTEPPIAGLWKVPTSRSSVPLQITDLPSAPWPDPEYRLVWIRPKVGEPTLVGFAALLSREAWAPAELVC